MKTSPRSDIESKYECFNTPPGSSRIRPTETSFKIDQNLTLGSTSCVYKNNEANKENTITNKLCEKDQIKAEVSCSALSPVHRIAVNEEQDDDDVDDDDVDDDEDHNVTVLETSQTTSSENVSQALEHLKVRPVVLEQILIPCISPDVCKHKASTRILSPMSLRCKRNADHLEDSSSVDTKRRNLLGQLSQCLQDEKIERSKPSRQHEVLNEPVSSKEPESLIDLCKNAVTVINENKTNEHNDLSSLQAQNNKNIDSSDDISQVSPDELDIGEQIETEETNRDATNDVYGAGREMENKCPVREVTGSNVSTNEEEKSPQIDSKSSDQNKLSEKIDLVSINSSTSQEQDVCDSVKSTEKCETKASPTDSDSEGDIDNVMEGETLEDKEGDNSENNENEELKDEKKDQCGLIKEQLDAEKLEENDETREEFSTVDEEAGHEEKTNVTKEVESDAEDMDVEDSVVMLESYDDVVRTTEEGNLNTPEKKVMYEKEITTGIGSESVESASESSDSLQYINDATSEDNGRRSDSQTMSNIHSEESQTSEKSVNKNVCLQMVQTKEGETVRVQSANITENKDIENINVCGDESDDKKFPSSQQYNSDEDVEAGGYRSNQYSIASPGPKKSKVSINASPEPADHYIHVENQNDILTELSKSIVSNSPSPEKELSDKTDVHVVDNANPMSCLGMSKDEEVSGSLSPNETDTLQNVQDVMKSTHSEKNVEDNLSSPSTDDDKELKTAHDFHEFNAKGSEDAQCEMTLCGEPCEETDDEHCLMETDPYMSGASPETSEDGNLMLESSDMILSLHDYQVGDYLSDQLGEFMQ